MRETTDKEKLIEGLQTKYLETTEGVTRQKNRLSGIVKWTPCDKPPEVDEYGESDYILLSFHNYPLPAIGRYQWDERDGAYYIGDDDEPCNKIGLFVNAWMPLPEPYRDGEL